MDQMERGVVAAMRVRRVWLWLFESEDELASIDAEGWVQRKERMLKRIKWLCTRGGGVYAYVPLQQFR